MNLYATLPSYYFTESFPSFLCNATFRASFGLAALTHIKERNYETQGLENKIKFVISKGPPLQRRYPSES